MNVEQANINTKSSRSSFLWEWNRNTIWVAAMRRANPISSPFTSFFKVSLLPSVRRNGMRTDYEHLQGYSFRIISPHFRTRWYCNKYQSSANQVVDTKGVQVLRARALFLSTENMLSVLYHFWIHGSWLCWRVLKSCRGWSFTPNILVFMHS